MEPLGLSGAITHRRACWSSAFRDHTEGRAKNSAHFPLLKLDPRLTVALEPAFQGFTGPAGLCTGTQWFVLFSIAVINTLTIAASRRKGSLGLVVPEGKELITVMSKCQAWQLEILDKEESSRGELKQDAK